MTVYPKCEYLKISMICTSLLGIFPRNLMFQNSKTMQNLYFWFSNLMLGYYVVFITRAYIQLYLIFSREGFVMNAISANLVITLIYTVTFTRQIIMRNNKGFQKLIEHIIETEKNIYLVNDEALVRIYKKCANDTQKKSRWYLIILFIITMQYIIRPALMTPSEHVVGNITVTVRPLPLSSWMPFDAQVHYIPAYIWNILDSLVGASFVTYTDIFMFNLIVYPTGQLKMLQYMLRNFDKYREKAAEISGQTDDGFMTFRNFIDEHRRIVDYINNFDDSMSTLMTFDFLQSSLQVASAVTQDIGSEITIVVILFVGILFFGMILRLFLYYYYANEVIILSIGLSMAVCDSYWYNQSRRVKYMMFIFLMRTQKPLKLSIGAFGVMSLQSFIAILKATYSYMTLMIGTAK